MYCRKKGYKDSLSASLYNQQSEERKIKVTENKQINKLWEKEGEWCIIKKGKREKKEVVSGARC